MDIYFYTVIPSALVFLCFVVLIRRDGMARSDLKPWAATLVIVLSVIWPAGVLMLASLAWSALWRRFNA